MSRDNVQHENNTKIDVTWECLIEHSEAEIRSCREKIARLNKSIRFFRKQVEGGAAFPIRQTRKGRKG